MLYSFLLEPEQAMCFLGARGFLDALTQKHQKQNTLPKTRFKVSGKLRLFNSQHCEGDTLHWSDSLPSEENGSLTMVIAWHLHLCSLFGSGDSMWTGWLREYPINWQHGQNIECSALSGSELEQATWFLVATGFLQAVTQQYQKQNPLPNTRFEGSKKLQLSQLSTLPRRHYSLTWPFSNLETVKIMVVSQWLLADTCMCVFLLNWIGGRMSHQLAIWAEHWTRANVCPFSMAKLVQCISMLCSFWLGTGTGNVIPGSERIPASHRSIRNKTLFPRQGLRCRENSGFSTLNIAKETLFIDLTLCEHGNCEENGSLTVVTCWHLHVYPFFSIFSAVLVIALNLIGGRMHHTAASEQKTLFPTQGLRCLENSSFLSFQHCQGDTIHWPDPLRIWKLWREWFCHNGQLLAHACVPFILYRVEQNVTWLSCLGHSATLQSFHTGK